jgi:esterase/lipase
MTQSKMPTIFISLAILTFLITAWLIISYILYIQSGKVIFQKERSYHVYPLHQTEYQQKFAKLPNNTTIDLWYSPNKNSNQLIIYLHGNSGRIPSLYNDLTEYGSVLAPAYPGFHFSEGIPTQDNIFQTATFAYQYAQELGYDPENIILLGHSFGGAPAIYLASQDIVAKRLIVINSFSSMYSMCRQQYGPFCELGKTLYFSTRYAQSVQIPTTIAHLKTDKRVPFEEGQKLFKAIGTNEKEFIELTDNVHPYPNLKELQTALSE